MGDEDVWYGDKDYWTVEEVAEFLGLKVDSARNWLQSHEIRGRQRYYAEQVREIRASQPGRGHYPRDKTGS